jgi:nitroimidazol reductase NimA-like FMN-containing flavoprotein (pyridoxamine 5'-phosphate oxidase superfamily)
MVTQGVPPAAAELLTTGREMGHLATSVDDRPHVAPVWYHYADETIELVTGGQKLANVRENPKVALSVESSTDGHEDWWVICFGTAEVVTDEEELWAGRTRLFQRYRDRDPTLEQDGEPPEALLRIDVGSTSYGEF